MWVDPLNIPWRRAWQPHQYSCLENPWMEDPGRLRSIGSQRIGHSWSDWACTHVGIFGNVWKHFWVVQLGNCYCIEAMVADNIVQCTGQPLSRESSRNKMTVVLRLGETLVWEAGDTLSSLGAQEGKSLQPVMPSYLSHSVWSDSPWWLLSGLSCFPPGTFPTRGTEPRSPTWQADFFFNHCTIRGRHWTCDASVY